MTYACSATSVARVLSQLNIQPKGDWTLSDFDDRPWSVQRVRDDGARVVLTALARDLALSTTVRRRRCRTHATAVAHALNGRTGGRTDGRRSLKAAIDVYYTSGLVVRRDVGTFPENRAR
ncbi:hypothetical protein V3C99_003144 [Haemonchus contortus]|uniref:Transposase n=1 Tax=Haemonchus contortus TaxID=6289 RepID=A0A7I5E6Q3_HAECO